MSFSSPLIAQVCHSLERLIQKDPGQRGIKNLHVPHQFLHAMQSGLLSSKHVILSTGFPCNTDREIPGESDGPPGILILAHSLLKQDRKRKVSIVYDSIHNTFMPKLITFLKNAMNDGKNGTNANDFNQRLNFYEMEMRKNLTENEIAIACQKFFDMERFKNVDLMIASELAGFTIDSKNERRFKTMTNRDITDYCGITADLFDYAFKHKKENSIVTIGIGDGGNEVGMGKYMKNVQQFIMNGKDIACAVECDFCITAGVSNWGSEALAIAIAVLGSNDECPPSYILCDNKLHHKLYAKTYECGALDGVAASKGWEGSVDGLKYEVHANMWKEMCETALLLKKAKSPQETSSKNTNTNTQIK